jgi:hypothetical protein
MSGNLTMVSKGCNVFVEVVVANGLGGGMARILPDFGPGSKIYKKDRYTY